MLYVILIIMATMIVISRFVINDKLSKTIIMIYIVWWLIWLGLSTFNFYDLFSVETSTYLLLMLNVVMFCIGFLFCGVFKARNKINIQCIHEKVTKHSGFLKLVILVVIILLYYYIRYKNVVDSGISLNNRMERFAVGNVFSSAKELLFFNYFIEPFTYAIAIIFAYMIIYGEFKNITFILLALSMFLYAGIGSGRGPVINILIAMSLIFFIRVNDSAKKINIDNLIKKVKKTKKIRLRNILFIVSIVLIIFVYLAWLTASRLGYTELSLKAIQIGGNEFFKQCMVYFTGPFRTLDYGLKVYPERVGYLFGRGTFAGIDEIINIAFSIIGINYNSANGIIADLLQNNIIQIGYNQSISYAYTNVMIHYFDFGVLGVIIFPFLYGIFVRKSIFLYQKKSTLPILVIMVFLFNTMLNSVFSWGLQSPASNILLVCCYFWHKISKKEHDNEYFMVN